jgi:two-component system, LytTR family, response regulator AlgR
MRILIVDDEPLARERLASLVGEIGLGELVGLASNGKEALDSIRAYAPELVLLDIRMPGIDGMQVSQTISELYPRPMVIFTTAYTDHAFEAFDINAVDYLLKPIRKDKLRDAIRKAQILLQQPVISPNPTQNNTPSRSHIKVKTSKNNIVLIPLNEIYYFATDYKYITVCRRGKDRLINSDPLLNETIKDLEQEFGGQFLRINRGTLVAVHYMAGLISKKDGHYYVLLRDQDNPEFEAELEVSRRHISNVRRLLSDMRLLD